MSACSCSLPCPRIALAMARPASTAGDRLAIVPGTGAPIVEERGGKSMRQELTAGERTGGAVGEPAGGKALTVALLAAMLVVHNAQRTGVVPLFTDLQSRFGVDYGGVGTLFAAYVLGYAIFQAIAGLVGDRFNARTLLLTGLAFSTLFSALFAGTHNYELALVARFLLGATGAFLYTPSMKLGITLFAREERGRVMGLLQSGAGLGAVGALILVPIGVERLGMTGGLFTLPLFAAAIFLVALVMLP